MLNHEISTIILRLRVCVDCWQKVELVPLNTAASSSRCQLCSTTNLTSCWSASSLRSVSGAGQHPGWPLSWQRLPVAMDKPVSLSTACLVNDVYDILARATICSVSDSAVCSSGVATGGGGETVAPTLFMPDFQIRTNPPLIR